MRERSPEESCEPERARADRTHAALPPTTDSATAGYTPRSPEQTLLHRIVGEQLEPFLARARETGQPAPLHRPPCRANSPGPRCSSGSLKWMRFAAPAAAPACACSRRSKAPRWPGKSSSASIYPRAPPRSNPRQAAPRSGPRPILRIKSNKAGGSIRRHPTQTARDRLRATRLIPRALQTVGELTPPRSPDSRASAVGADAQNRTAPPHPDRATPLKSSRHGAVLPLIKSTLTECLLSDIVENTAFFLFSRMARVDLQNHTTALGADAARRDGGT